MTFSSPFRVDAVARDALFHSPTFSLIVSHTSPERFPRAPQLGARALALPDPDRAQRCNGRRSAHPVSRSTDVTTRGKASGSTTPAGLKLLLQLQETASKVTGID